MDIVLRPALPEDEAAIAAFTHDTFPWGDYITRVFEDWLVDRDACNLVAEAGGEVVGLARGTRLSPTEAWAQGLRVHPGHRRRGIGAALMSHLLTWASGLGARVMRLSTEDWNQAARGHIASLGFRPVGTWLMAERSVGPGAPVAEGNGGKRVPPAERLAPAPASEAEAAMLAWAAGELDLGAHGLFPIGWSWRHLTQCDLEAAAGRRALWQGRPGWAVGEIEEDTFRVSWLATWPEDARAMAQGLLDLAGRAGAERLEAMFPTAEWLSREFEALGCRLHPLTVYGRMLGA